MSGSLRSIFFWRNRWSWGWIGRLPPSRFDLYTAMWKLQELVLLSNCLDCAPPRNTASRYRFAACRYAGAQAQPIFLDIRRSETTDSDLADSIFLSCYNSRRVAKARSWMRGTVLARFRQRQFGAVLEHVLQRELDLPVVRSGSRDHTERAVAQSSSRKVELRAIEGVEEFGAE